MPRLSEIGDPAELDNLYSDKVIVYVEGADDLALFTDLVGPNLADRLEFKIPDEQGSGYHMVKNRVARERARNPKIHGLLDGEAAIAFGDFAAFLAGRPIFFTLPGGNYEGLLFLAENELENLVLCHVDVAQFISGHVRFGQIGIISPADVELKLNGLARRFFLLALLRFVAGGFHAAGQPCGVIDAHVGMFQDKKLGVAKILRHLKAKLDQTDIGWPAFAQKLHELADHVSHHFAEQELDTSDRDRQLRRIADGKEMLKSVRDRFNGPQGWEGQLAGQLKLSDYAQEFVRALEAATGCNDNP